MLFRCALAVILAAPFLHAQPVLDAFVSTGDNHWLGSSLPVDSPQSIEDTFDFLQKACGVQRVYWRGLEEATWIQSMDERPENCRYYSFWQWIRRLYREVDPDKLAVQAARKRGMDIWGVGTLFDWGSEADTPGFGDYPANSESRLRLQHPEWAPVDRHCFRHQGGPIELAYPEARKALVDLHMDETRRVDYDGILMLTYAENYSLRFEDEFGFNEPIAREFKKRYKRDLLKDPYTRYAGREDWLRLRGEYLTTYLRELKAELAKTHKKLGVFMSPQNIRQPLPWNVPELMRTAGAHYLDVDTWVRDGIVDLLPVYGNSSPQLQDAAIRDCRWLVRNTPVEVSIMTSSPLAEKWKPLQNDGLRTIAAISEDAMFAERGPVPEQTAAALGSGDLARVCKALSQVIAGKLPAVSADLLPLAQKGNLVQRRMALQALGLTKDATVLPLIERSLVDTENGIRCMAAQVLRTFHGEGAAAAILAAMDKLGNHPMREVAGTALMGMKPFPREILHKTLAESKNIQSRIVALRALSVNPTAADVPALQQGLTGPDRYPRFLAVTGLGNVRKNEEAVKALINAVGHFDAVVANRAAASLGEMAKRKEPALKPLEASALAKLTQRYDRYTTDYLGVDHDWGYRTVGNALLEFGPQGRAVLEKALADKKDLVRARFAFRVLYLPQRPNSFSEVSEAENEAAFAHLPPPPPEHIPVTIVVDPAGEVKTIEAAVKKARPGDTIRLTKGTYKETLAFYDRSGEHGKPIIFDGQGSTLDGGDDQDLSSWENLGGDLYRKKKLVKMDDGMLMRWFMLFDGKMQRMGRCSKGPSLALKKAEDLQLNEWTYVKAEDALYVRVKPGTKVTAPVRANGVAVYGTCRHLIIRNVSATHVYNDGYNIHGWCRDVLFENVQAIDCGDDGVSAHDDCQYVMDGLVSQGNATGITDTVDSVTHYKNVTIRDCDGFDLFFIGSNAHSVTDAVVHSRAARAVVVDGASNQRESNAPCSLRLENVKLIREGKPDEIRVTANSQMDMENVHSVGLMLQVTGGEAKVNHCSFTGTPKPLIHLWPNTKWSGDHNVFGVSAIRAGNDWFYPKDAKAFSERFRSDAASHWDN